MKINIFVITIQYNEINTAEAFEISETLLLALFVNCFKMSLRFWGQKNPGEIGLQNVIASGDRSRHRNLKDSAFFRKSFRFFPVCFRCFFRPFSEIIPKKKVES